MTSTWTNFFIAVIATILPFVFALLVSVLNKAWKYLEEKIASIKNDTVRNALMSAEHELQNLTTTIVSSLNQTLVADLKSQNNGKLSLADAKRVKDDALSKIKQLLSDEAKNVLETHRSDLTDYLSHVIESEVNQQKK